MSGHSLDSSAVLTGNQSQCLGMSTAEIYLGSAISSRLISPAKKKMKTKRRRYFLYVHLHGFVTNITFNSVSVDEMCKKRWQIAYIYWLLCLL